MPEHAKKQWCFTINNYTDEIVNRLRNVDPNLVKYLVVGFEIAPTTLTPHLQCYVHLKKKMRREQTRIALIGNFPAHFEAKSPDSTEHQAAEYCKKDKTHDQWFEFGSYENIEQGKRSDLDKFKDDVKALNGKATYAEMRELHSKVAAKYGPFFRNYIDDIANAVKPDIDGELRPWQSHLKTLLDADPDSRQIIFVVDIHGNTGKSWFSHYMVAHSEKMVQVLSPGKTADMAYTLMNNPEVVIIDAPRSKQGDYLQYDFLEAVKNGYVFSPKYESRYKSFKHPHVVVMMNEPPDANKLSADRYHYIYPEEFN